MSEQETPAPAIRVEEILSLLSLPDDQWDVLVVGDGSGSRWGYPGGWATILFDKDSGLRKWLCGSCSDTTINVCELEPYVHAMHWYDRNYGDQLLRKLRRARGTATKLQVHVVTDCQIIANQGNDVMHTDRNYALWAPLDVYERYGYRFKFHWIDRDRFEANRFCDYWSKHMRLTLQQIGQSLISLRDVSPYVNETVRVKT